MSEKYDVAVVGLGALGSATAFQLAKRGKKVIAFEQFELGHVRGASHDTSRIIRRTYRHSEYIDLADSAYRDWEDLESVAGERFVTKTGGMVLFPGGSTDILDEYTRSMDAHSLPFSVLDAGQLQRRYPQFQVPEGAVALSQNDTGIVPAGRTTTVLQVLARTFGAILRANCPVTEIVPTESGVTVITDSGRVTANSVVLCTDAWTNVLLKPLGSELPLVSTLEQVTYFQPDDARDFAPGTFPVWIWEDMPSYYGFPLYGESTVKAARDVSDIPADPWHRSFEPVPARLAELSEFMSTVIPGSGRPIRTTTCQYTLTPDRHFVVSAVAGHPQIFVALGAGHAFKFAPTIGRVLADLSTTGNTSEDLSLFGFDRPALRNVAAV